MNVLRAIIAASAAQLAKRTEDLWSTDHALHVVQLAPAALADPTQVIIRTSNPARAVAQMFVGPGRLIRAEVATIAGLNGTGISAFYDVGALPADGTATTFVGTQQATGASGHHLSVLDYSGVRGLKFANGCAFAISSTQATLTAVVGWDYQFKVWWLPL